MTDKEDREAADINFCEELINSQEYAPGSDGEYIEAHARYAKAINYGRAHPDREMIAVRRKMNKWIPITESLPKEHERVICRGTHEYGDQTTFNVQAGYRWNCNGKDIWSTLEWDGCGGNDWFGEVTHWMPFPEFKEQP